jgi:hypothetical protein
MANEQELNKKSEYFEYVESRIENLEKLILKKDEELKSLILKTMESGVGQSNSNEESETNEEAPVLLDEKINLERVFEDINEEEAQFLKDEESGQMYKADELNKQLDNIEKREKMVQDMLDSLGTALAILKKRHEEVNRKEESLNREYEKLQEIEMLYRSSKGLDSLTASFGQFSLNEEKTLEERISLKNDSKE